MFLKLYKVSSDDDDSHVTECFSSSGLSTTLSMINEFKKENI